MVYTLMCFIAITIIITVISDSLSFCPQGPPLVAGRYEDDVKSIHSHRITMEISGHSLKETSVQKVNGNYW